MLDVAETSDREHRIPIDGRDHLLESSAIDRIVRGLDVTLAFRRPVDRCELGFKSNDGIGGGRCRRVADELEYFRDVCLIGLAIGVETVALVEVVVAIRHSQAGLSDADRVLRRIGRIRKDIHADRARIIDVAYQLDDVGLGFGSRDRVDIPFQWLYSSGFNRGFTHP